jgi:hypothetical protein
MNTKLDNYLCGTYPKIFAERWYPTSESCMGRGFECGDGWFPLINMLCHAIQEHIDWSNKYPEEGQKPIPQFVALQVKEKFGGLRIYYSGGDKYCQGLVDMAEAYSYSICEVCGTGGPSVGRTTCHWIQSMCPECAKRSEKDIAYNNELKALMDEAIKEQKHANG